MYDILLLKVLMSFKNTQMRVKIVVHWRPDITRMSGSTTSDHVISESRYTEVFYYVTNSIQS